MRYFLVIATVFMLSNNCLAIDAIGSAKSGVESAAGVGMSLITGAKTVYDNRCKVCNRESCRSNTVGALCKRMCRHKDVLRFGIKRLNIYSADRVHKCLKTYAMKNRDKFIEAHKKSNNLNSNNIDIWLYNELDAEIFNALVTDLYQASKDEQDEKLQLIIDFSDNILRRMLDPQVYRSIPSRVVTRVSDKLFNDVKTNKLVERYRRDDKTLSRIERMRAKQAIKQMEEDVEYADESQRADMSKAKRAKIRARHKLRDFAKRRMAKDAAEGPIIRNDEIQRLDDYQDVDIDEDEDDAP